MNPAQPAAEDHPWFIVYRSSSRIRGTPVSWQGYLTLFGTIFGMIACGLGAGLLWAFTGQWIWFAAYFVTIFPGAFVLLFTVMRRKSREIQVGNGPIQLEIAKLQARVMPQASVAGLALQAIDHVQVAIPPGGEDEARPFYKDLLGLPEQPKPPELAARGGAWFESAVVKVHCGVEDPFTPARKAHIAFRVGDVQGLAQRARTAGYEVVDDDALEGHERIYINDPFGNRLEFLRPLNS